MTKKTKRQEETLPVPDAWALDRADEFLQSTKGRTLDDSTWYVLCRNHLAAMFMTTWLEGGERALVEMGQRMSDRTKGA